MPSGTAVKDVPKMHRFARCNDLQDQKLQANFGASKISRQLWGVKAVRQAKAEILREFACPHAEGKLSATCSTPTDRRVLRLIDESDMESGATWQ